MNLVKLTIARILAAIPFVAMLGCGAPSERTGSYSDMGLQITPAPIIRDAQTLRHGELAVLTETGVILFLQDKGTLKKTDQGFLARRVSTFEDTIWALDNNGDVHRTSLDKDGWTRRGRIGLSGDTVIMLAFVSHDIGWALTPFSLLLTEDGGATWRQTEIGAPDSKRMTLFSTMRPANADVCWVGMTNGRIVRTTDRGKSWTFVPFAEVVDIRSIYTNDGIRVWVGTAGKGGGLFRTENSGETWARSEVEIESKSYSITSISFSSKAQGWAAGYLYADDPMLNSPDGALLLTTTDGGESWTRITDVKDQLLKISGGDSTWGIGENEIFIMRDASWHALIKVNKLFDH